MSAANKAFGVSIAKFSHDGEQVQAPTGQASAPDGVAASVIAISGLDTTATVVEPLTRSRHRPAPGSVTRRSARTWYGDKNPTNTPTPDGTVLPTFNGKVLPYAPCGYTGPQLRNSYEAGARKALTGKGVTVAITDAYASPTIACRRQPVRDGHR